MLKCFITIFPVGTTVEPDQLVSLTLDQRKITLALISKLTLVKSESNSFGLKNRFSFDPRWAIRVDLVRL